MNRTAFFRTTLTLFLISMLTLTFDIQPIEASNQESGTIGVKPSDYAVYQMTFNYTSNDPNPPGVLPNQSLCAEIERLGITVESVVDKKITFLEWVIFRNETAMVESKSMNLTECSQTAMWFILANLEPGNSTSLCPASPVVNATSTRRYAGAFREVNYVYDQHVSSYAPNHIVNQTHHLYYDKTTGILDEVNTIIDCIELTEGYETYISVRVLIKNTNTWQPDKITIKADGSVDPPTAPITTLDNVTYRLTDDVLALIVVERSNITIDGQEYTALGNNVGCGFNVTNVSNATIQHTHIRQFECGIYLSSSTHIIIKNNTMANNIQGILLEYSSDNSISGNNVTDNSDGISLDESANNVLRNNILNGNKYDFFVLTSIFPNARKLSYFYQDIDESNTVNGKPMYYWINEHDRAVPSNAGYIALVNCSNIMVEGFTLTSKGKGVLLANTNNSKVTNNNLTNTSYSIWLYSSSNNDISGNSMVNVLSGVSLLQSHNNIILRNSMVDYRNGINLCESNDNNIFENSIANGERGKGISLSDSQDNNVSENDISNNRFGIVVSTSSNNTFSGNDIANITDSGFWLTMSLSNILSGNRVMNSDCGIDLYRSSKNLLAGNTLANNRLSMRAWSSNNRIYHNNFIDTFWNIIIDSGNIWDNGYPSGGNYWSDYYGTDLHWGPHQNLTGSDGIGDESHPIGSGDQDNYPLMNPWMIVDTIPPTTGIILPENITYHPPVPLNFTVCDPVHMSPISWIGYSLDSEANVTITGNTTLIDLSFGSHTITVHANDSSGNTGSSETVYFTVTFPTDLNLDGKVRIDDLLLGAQAFGTDPDHPRWNPAADINKDARIRVDDILAIALNFGQE